MSADSLCSNNPSNWTHITLGELCQQGGGEIQTGPFGSQLHASDYVEIGIPSIMPKNISVDGVSTNDIARITEADASRLSKYRVQSDDIVYSRRGDVEKCALITENENGWLCGTGCLRIRLGSQAVASAQFIHAYLCLPSIREWVVRHAVGATMPNLNTSILSAIPLVLPSQEVATSIAKQWTSITEKITLNRQINQTLEQMAQALFKSWFVDFEPVKAMAEAIAAGRDPERAAMAAIAGKDEAALDALSPSQQQQLAATARLFPSRLVESELGLVPEGWEVKSFGALLSKSVGGDWGKGAPDEKHTERVRIIRGTDINTLKSGEHESVPERYVETKKLTTRQLIPGDIVLEVSGGTKNQPTGRTLFITEQIITRLGGVVEPTSFCRLFRPASKEIGMLLGEHMTYIYGLGKTWGYQNQSTGISNFQTKMFLERELIVTPTTTVLAEFYKNVHPMVEKQHSNENMRLKVLRDTLLPKLLSGELRVDQAEQHLAEVS